LWAFLIWVAPLAARALFVAVRTADFLAVTVWSWTARLRFARLALLRLLIVRHEGNLRSLPALAETTRRRTCRS
jgi:hypothetical protein